MPVPISALIFVASTLGIEKTEKLGYDGTFFLLLLKPWLLSLNAWPGTSSETTDRNWQSFRHHLLLRLNPIHSPFDLPSLFLEPLVDGLRDRALHEVHVADDLGGEGVAEVLVELAVLQVV